MAAPLRQPRAAQRWALVAATLLALVAPAAEGWAAAMCSTESSLPMSLLQSSAGLSVAEAWLRDTDASEFEDLGSGMTCADGSSCVLEVLRGERAPAPAEGPVCRVGDPRCELNPAAPPPPAPHVVLSFAAGACADELVIVLPCAAEAPSLRHAREQRLDGLELPLRLERPPRA